MEKVKLLLLTQKVTLAKAKNKGSYFYLSNSKKSNRELYYLRSESKKYFYFFSSFVLYLSKPVFFDWGSYTS